MADPSSRRRLALLGNIRDGCWDRRRSDEEWAHSQQELLDKPEAERNKIMLVRNKRIASATRFASLGGDAEGILGALLPASPPSSPTPLVCQCARIVRTL